MARLLQFLALLFLARYVFRAVGQWLSEGGARQRVEGQRQGSQPIYRGHMVRDPMCGVFLLRESAVEEARAGETHHFCSENCRRAFRTGEVTVR